MIHLNYRDSRPIYEQIKSGFINLISAGGLKPGEKMPSVRELATQLAINPNTIQRAYKEMETEGYICSVPGKGSFVAERNDAIESHKAALLESFTKLAGELRDCGVGADMMKKIIDEGGNER